MLVLVAVQLVLLLVLPGGAVDVGVVVFSPQLCVGFLFLILYPGFLLLRLPPPLSHTLTQAQLCHIASLTYNNFT